MDQFTKEGRKLRPRKTAGPRPNSEKVEYTPGAHRSEGEHRSSNYEGHRNYGEGRLYLDKLRTWSQEILGDKALTGREVLEGLATATD